MAQLHELHAGDRKMLDIARAGILILAIVQAIRCRFALGILFGCLLAIGFAAIAMAAATAIAHGSINGEYGFSFVYIGPTSVPLGQLAWLPTAIQVSFAALSAVPAIRALRTPESPATTPFVLLFVSSALIAVTALLNAFLLWRQESTFPEYWQNP